MAKLPRVLQKIFGSTAPGTEIKKIGSLAAGSPEAATDLVEIQEKANYLTGWSGCVLGDNAPTREDRTSLDKLMTQQLAYLMERGIPEWDSATTYYIDSYCLGSDGMVYKSLTDNNLNNLISDTAEWEDILKRPIEDSRNSLRTLAAQTIRTGTAQAISGAAQLESIAWAPSLSLYCAVAASGTTKVTTSAEGGIWTARTESTSGTWTSVAWSESLSLFVACSYFGTSFMSSPDGITWTSRTVTSHSYNEIIWVEELTLFVAVAQDGKATTSPDGITWTERTVKASSNNAQAVTWSPELGLLVAVSSTFGSNKVYTSTDGITWDEETGVDNEGWRAVTWSPELGLFAAISGENSTTIAMTSPDGVTWTERFTEGYTANSGIRINVRWIPELQVFASIQRSDVCFSFDGITWLKMLRGVDAGASIFDFAWSPLLGRIVAITTNNGAYISN